MTVIYSAQNGGPEKQDEAPEKKSRNALLPLLVVLFVISYSILTLLVVEQGRTIEVQRGLLREMLKDSTQLATLKGKIARDQAAAQSQSKSTAGREETTDGGSANDGAKAPRKETPKQGKSRTMKQAPERPAADLQDVRRSTRVI